MLLPPTPPPTPPPNADRVAHTLSGLTLSEHALLPLSDALLVSFRGALQSSRETMLPSYIRRLPTGAERGSAVAVDLGGSTLRVAVVQLSGGAGAKGVVVKRREVGGEIEGMHMLRRKAWTVDEGIKRLASRDFFDWIAERVREVVVDGMGAVEGQTQEEEGKEGGGDRAVTMGLTWSFPLEQTGLASGRVQAMGKGFRTSDEIAGSDLRDHFEAAFARKGLRLRMNALMNDTEATLLSAAYTRTNTSLSLICGTGCNAAVALPISALTSHKLGVRPVAWLRAAHMVLVNSECSMFGAGILPTTPADIALDAAQPRPGFQPLEQLVSGRYLGEIARLSILNSGILKEAEAEAEAEEKKEDGSGRGRGGGRKGLSEDAMATWMTPYAFTTAQMAALESSRVEECTALTPTPRIHAAARAICRAVSARAAAVYAVTVFTLWRLQRDAFLAASSSSSPSSSVPPTPPPSPRLAATRHHQEEEEVVHNVENGDVTVAFCGAVFEKHPTAREQCQGLLDRLVEMEVKRHDILGDAENGRGVAPMRRRLVLEWAGDSGLLGAAVASIVNRLEEEHVVDRAKL